MSPYRSIFLEPDWAHALYYGWKSASLSSNVHVLRKSTGPATRDLVLSDSNDPEELASIIAEARPARALGEIVIHDFAGVLRCANHSKLKRFSALPRHQWLLNGGTFVIDLRQDDDVIFERMTSDTRRRIRKAERTNISVRAESHPDPSRLERFFLALQQMNNRRNLRSAHSGALRRMFDDGRAILLSNESGNEPGAYAMLYKAGNKAIWLHGVGRGTTTDSGQLLQWRAVQALKADGVCWYDLGGAPSNEASGIYRFKQGLGGEFISLGQEHYLRTILARIARAALAGAQTIRR